MSAKGQEDPGEDLASRVGAESPCSDMKRAAAKKLIERYFYQLTDGCGNPQCDNHYCASSGKVTNLTPNQAAAQAIQLFSQEARLCDRTQPSKVARTSREPGPASLAKPRLPVKSMNPTCSIKGTATKDDLTRSPSNHETPPPPLHVRSSSCTDNPLQQDSKLSTHVPLPSKKPRNSCSKPAPKNVAIRKKRQRTRTPSENDSMDFREISETDVSQSDSFRSSSSRSRDTIESVEQSSFARILDINDVRVPNRNNRSMNYRRLVQRANVKPLGREQKQRKVSRRHRNSRPRDSKRKKRDPQYFVRELLVLALYLRYLQAKRYSRTYSQRKLVPYLTEAKLLHIIDECKAEGSYSLLIRTLGEVFSSAEILSRSFPKTEKNHSPLAALFERAPADLLSTPGDLNKEAVRSLQGEDKEEDSSDPTPAVPHPDDTSVDLASVRRAFTALWSLPGEVFESALVHALVTLADNIELDLRVFGIMPSDSMDSLLNVFLIAFEIPVLDTGEYLDFALHMLCKATGCLPISAQARLARVWARHCKSRLPSLLQALQELITDKVIGGSFTRDYCVQDAEMITAPTKVMKILYYASMLAGELDPPEACRDEDTTDPADADKTSSQRTTTTSSTQLLQDPLAAELGICSLDARKPFINFADFYNELLSDTVEMDKDFAYYKSEHPMKFSFMNYAFILTTATKSLGLYYDNRIRMYSERRMSFFQTVVGQPTNPYLRLKVRRDYLIDDALVELEMVAMENPTDLKKQLFVEFEGEQGVDEGGVSKEFFQLVVEEIFNPDYGMFTTQEETNTTWFNPTSFESDAQFTLIGVVLGLAIYNNVILDVRFPMVVYRKLLGRKGGFADLEDSSPTLYRTLTEMLNYTGDDMAETFMQTFRVSYKDVFGSVLFHELREKGDEIYVNQENKKEFVELYADFLLNGSVERQFKAFRRGFQMVTDESPLALLFRPEEIEQLVCGSKVFDFAELEAATEYDGYTVNSATVKNFWQVAHALPPESQRRLLQFTTGSDRVPVGGLSRLKMIISRHGSDSDSLPIAHTCFNTLLLPDYGTIEKLRDRLLKAINYSMGFGML